MKITNNEKTEIRACTLMRHKLDIDGRMIRSKLVTLLGGSASCLRLVYRQIERSITRRGLIEYIQQIGHPQTRSENIKDKPLHRLIEI